MLGKLLILSLIGLSGGFVVAGGLFGLIVGLGVISDLADRTHTGCNVHLYEDAVALGGIWGNVMHLYSLQVSYAGIWLGIFGLFAGIFSGCWVMALTEVLNVFPIFVRRLKLVKCIACIILGIALGKAAGSLIYFWMGWQ